jgi:hypothetical protein
MILTGKWGFLRFGPGTRHHMRRKFQVSVAVLAVAQAVSAEQGGAAEPPLVRLADFQEFFLKKVPTGGAGILVGATAETDLPEYLLKPTLFVPRTFFPKIASLCIETISIDGSYFSHGELSRADLESHRGTLRFVPNNTDVSTPEGTRWGREIREFGPANLAVLAGIGGCGSKENRNSRTFFIVDRSGSSLAPQHYRLYVNPTLADHVDVTYHRSDGREARVACVDPRSSFANTAFSLICELAGPFKNVTSVELVPSRAGLPLPPYRFDLVYAQEP